MFKLCTKFEQNRTIRGRVIDHLARFRRPAVGVGHFLRRVLRDAWIGPNFTKLGEGTGRSWPSYEFVSELRCLAAFSNAGASNLSDVENDAKFRTF